MPSEDHHDRVGRGEFDLADVYFRCVGPAIPIIGLIFVVGAMGYMILHPNDETSIGKSARVTAIFGLAVQMVWLTVLVAVVEI